VFRPPEASDAVRRYHDGTKHSFHQFARSLGYLDWSTQPRPFRAFPGAPLFPLFPSPFAARDGYAAHGPSYDQLYADTAAAADRRAVGILTAAALGDLLRHALGLTAWKQYRDARWSLRANPSSGNLHPTEAYLVCGATPGLAPTPGVYHYAADRHELELRCAFDERAWADACGGTRGVALVALTSIHWRESWKYGERAFRYCQHDLGHAIAALSLAARLVGCRARLTPEWSHRAIAALVGIDRDQDFVDAEREEAGCLVVLGDPEGRVFSAGDIAALVEAVSRGRWHGGASQLSEDHVQWTFIDEVAAATEWPGSTRDDRLTAGPSPVGARARADRRLDARALMRQRRSAVRFDARSAIDRPAFLAMLARAMPGRSAPWDAFWWPPAIHLVLFVHRVVDLEPGLYVLARADGALDRLRAAMGRDFLWDVEDAALGLTGLARGDCRRLAARLSCDQEIAGDGCFSLGMLADFDASLAAYGPAFYRHLFWEAGAIGQVLYLEAEAAGARGTGIGCFYDDPVHDALGLTGHAFQSLYHFAVGTPVEDTRLLTEPGYTWEGAGEAGGIR
jgi:SagB-type dehydrogenase family enzyme